MITPVKKSLFVVTTAIVMGSAVQSAYAAEHFPPQNITQQDKIGYDWTLIQQIDGISISLSIVDLGDERFLSVKFENTNSEASDFIWSMTKNNSAVVITEDEMMESIVRLESAQSAIVDGTYLIELSEGDQLSDFVVSIQPTKR
jgi:hypothetical protein